MTYAPDDAFTQFQYDPLHPHAVAWAFAPTGGFGAFVGPRPIVVDILPGGWTAQDYLEKAERYPANALNSRTSVHQLFNDGGAIVVIAGYPQAYGLKTPHEIGPVPAQYPGIPLTQARLVQWLKDQCGAGGELEGLGDPDNIVLLTYSAGSMNALHGVWTPQSWGLVTRAPGAQAGLGETPKSDHYPRAIVLQGVPLNPPTDDPSRKSSAGAYSPLVAAVAQPWKLRPRVSLFGTMTGTLEVGDAVTGAGATTERGVVAAVSGSGASTTVEILLEQGYAEDLINGDAFENGLGDSINVTAAPTILDKYGWLDAPQATREATSCALLLTQMRPSDLDKVKSIPIFAYQTGNPSVSHNDGTMAVRDTLVDVIPGKYGADDAHDTWHLGSLFTELGFDPTLFQVRWGEPAATATLATTAQTITNVVVAAGVATVTTSAAHYLRSGDLVDIGQVVGFTGLNGGPLAVTVVDATTFTVPVPDAAGAYTSGGVWVFHNAAGDYCDASAVVQEAYDWLRDVVGVPLT